MSLRDFVILTKIGKPRFITAYFLKIEFSKLNA